MPGAVQELNIVDVSSQPPAAGWIRRMGGLLVKRKGRLTVALVAALVSMGATSAVPLALRSIFDRIVGLRPRHGAAAGAARTGARGVSALAVRHPASVPPLLALLVLLGVFRLGAAFIRRYSAGRISLDVDYDLRTAIFDHLQRLDFARHDDLQTGQLVSRANSDVTLVQNFLNMLPITTSNLLQIAISTLIMLWLSPTLTLVALTALPLIAVITQRMRRWIFASSWEAQQRVAELSEVVEEAVYGVRVVKAFAQEDRELAEATEAATHLYGTRMRNIRIVNRYQPALLTIPVLAQVAILALGGWLVLRGSITLGTFLAFNTYLVQLVQPVRSFAGFLTQAQNARAGAERIFDLLDSTPSVVEAPDAHDLTNTAGEVTFDNVTFGYLRSRPILRDFSLTVAPGETVALVGTSGSGKSTLSLLVPRFYDVHGGVVTIDGQDVRSLTLDSLRRNVGVVFEESFLFSDTVRANIAFGRPDATDDEVREAAEAAEADGFIAELPDGYDTVVGERGYTLSGGQRQRIALARALLTNPRILLLDDATSSIDARTEEEIHQTLRRLMPGRTTLLVAHRRSTLDLADRIIVVDRGRVVDAGTHEVLSRRCSLYRELLTGPEEDSIDAVPEDATTAPSVVPSRSEVGRGGVAPTVTEAAWRRPESGATRPLAAASSFMGAGGVGRRLGAGGGFGMGRGGRGPMAGGVPPSAAVQEAIDHLPPVRDNATTDPIEAALPVADFSLRTVFRPYKKRLIVAFALAVGDTIAGDLAGPMLVRTGVDRGIAHRMLSIILVLSLGYLVLTLGDWLINWCQNLYTGRTTQELLFRLRIQVFAHLQRLGMDYYESEMAGRVLTRMGSDIEALQSLFQNGIINGVVNILQFLGGALVLFFMNARLAAVAMVVMIPVGGATQWFRRRSDHAYLRVRERIAAVNANFQESVSGIRVSQAYVREQHNIGQFQRLADDHLRARVETVRLQSLFFPFVDFLGLCAQGIVLGYGAKLIAHHQISAGALIAFVLYIDSVFDPIQQLSQVFDSYQQARAAMIKLGELMRMPVSTPVGDQPVVPGRLAGNVRFDGVRFRYPQGVNEALRGVDLSIPAGKTVALVGETGSGKSTIVKLLARFYDPTGGRILVDGVPLTDLDLNTFRSQLGIVPQEAFLFSGTVRDNIAFGRPDASDEDVEAAARATGAHDFIAELEGGYHHWVSERGRSLSTGQRQLIALARAQLVDPAILLLDEATSNLDLSTEARVGRAMRQVASGRTTIVIAHRLQTARAADLIVVINAGTVVEQGTHDQLLAANGEYASLYRSFEVQPSVA